MMKNQFSEYFPVSEDRVNQLLKSALIVLDANILLNSYRYSEKTREDFFEIFRSLKARLWVPHHAVREFLLNRASQIKSAAPAYGEAARVIDALLTKFKETNQHPFLSQAVYEETITFFGKLKEDLQKQRKAHSLDINKDPVIDVWMAILKGGIGSPITEKQDRDIFEEWKSRSERGIPPSLGDADKPRNRHGDLIIWKQILKRSAEKKSDIIFVTDDTKEDWWHDDRPHPLLIREFKKATSKNLHILTALQFRTKIGKVLKKPAEQETLDELEKVGSPIAFDPFRIVEEDLVRQQWKFTDEQLSIFERATRQMADLPRATDRFYGQLLDDLPSIDIDI